MTLLTKQKTCKVCGTPFHTILGFRNWCSPVCGSVIAEEKRSKKLKVEAVKERRETKQKLDKLKSRSAWAKEAQTAFNAWIRARDADQPCISCGRHHQGQYHAGHYLSVGARPELRFEPLNVHKQCAPCNTHLSGNAVLYRMALLQKHGLEVVEYLEGPHEPKKYSIDDYKAIKTESTAKARAIEKANA